ncbi:MULTISPECIES: factor-independent urate hydroxylase [Protofrankia]|uniref:Uricase n=1 Tax=Candidatus Protofrankia datiscae TaxID=2716812 RepID=F8B6D3_9ACTN|nr:MULTISPECIES: urate oxidase [Protofrankia]AEH09229.1 urate oxidase [Candidatus Protofrankia datiscae]
MAVVLGPNRYGKAEVRLVHVERSTPVHRIRDISVTSALWGDFTSAHVDGDNSHILATDTQKNTVHAFARTGGVGEIEQFGLRLARHFTTATPWVTGARLEIEEYGWQRIEVNGSGHDHAFFRSGGEHRTTTVTVDRDTAHVVSGTAGLVVLKSTGSAFRGFIRDDYTTLADTDDRVLATEITARWRYTSTAVEFDTLFPSIRATLLETFAQVPSSALQQTLYAMGREVLTAHADVAEIRLSMPNRHHFPVDLTPFGLDNPNVVFQVADRPYGRIEGTVLRNDVPAAESAWSTFPGGG